MKTPNLGLAACLLWILVQTPNAGGEGYYIYPNYSIQTPANQIQVFDNRVFNLDSKPGPQIDAEGRYVAGPAKYTNHKRSEWIRECQYLEDVDFGKFQKCFRDHREEYLRRHRTL